MTVEDFRQDEQRVAELRTVLSNPVLQEAMLIIHDSKAIVDADDASDQLASVRKLSNLAGRAEVIRELYELATPLAKPQPPKMPDYGINEEPPPDWKPI